MGFQNEARRKQGYSMQREQLEQRVVAGCSRNSVYFGFVTAGWWGEWGSRTWEGAWRQETEYRTELLIAIRKALGSHQRNRQSSKVDQRWAMEEDSGRMRKNWSQETWEESKLGTDPHTAGLK